MDAAKVVTATFTLEQYALTIGTDGNGSGTVTADPDQPQYDCGTVVTLTATADIGSTFTGWSGACPGTGGCVVTMDAAKSVTATFSLQGNFLLTVNLSGSGAGTVTSTPAGIDCGVDCTEAFSPGLPGLLFLRTRVGGPWDLKDLRIWRPLDPHPAGEPKSVLRRFIKNTIQPNTKG